MTRHEPTQRNTDPFHAEPRLRGKIADPLASRFRTIDLALIDATMHAAGAPPDWRRSDQAREASRIETLTRRPETELWVFGYGSLIWDPGFVFDDVRIARLEGFHRRFCLRSELGRGSVEKPGLMLGLDRGGSCESLAFRVAPDVLETETRLLWQREMLRHTYAPTYVPLATATGPITALTFIIDPTCVNYRDNLSQSEAALLLATGEGIFGSSFDYIDNLVRHLDAFGIHDDKVRTLHRQVLEQRQTLPAENR